MLKAGVAQIDISPEKGLELAGYPHYPRNNTGVHDPLFAACLYVFDGSTELAMVTLDLLFFSKRHVAEVRRRVQAVCGIPGDHVMISCSHTHSGPWAAGRLDVESLEAGKEQPHAYVESLIERITRIVAQAKSTAFEATLATGCELCGAEQGVGGNRTLRGGPHDPLVSVIAVKDTSGCVRGVFANYTLHPTFIHEWSDVVTADYPAYVRQEIAQRAPDAVFGFAQGASGNQSSRYYRTGESFDEAERVGRLLGSAAMRVATQGTYQSEIRLSAASSTVEPIIRAFGEEVELEQRVASDRAVYEDLYARYGTSTNRDEYDRWQNANLKLLGSEDQLGYVRMQNRGVTIELLRDERPAEIQVFLLGSCCVIGLPGEAFVEYALYLKAMAGYPMVVVNTLANGCLPGYLITPQGMSEGGYEADTSMLDVAFGRTLVDCALDTIARCAKDAE